MTGPRGAVLIFGLFSFCLVWLSVGVSLLDDDWGHLKLAALGLPGILTTNWEGITGYGGYYRPVSVISLYLNFLVSGYSPSFYHVTNVLIHCCCCWLVFLLGKALFPRASQRVPWAALFLFLVLPIHTDSIFWIVGRTDSLCALFFFATLFLFLRYLDHPSALKLYGIGAFFLLALYAKEMALSLPGILAFLGLYRRGFKSSSVRCVLYVCGGVLVFYFTTRWMVLGGVFSGVPDRNFSLQGWGLQVLRAGAMICMTDYHFFGPVLLLVTAVLICLTRRGFGIFQDVVILAGITVISLVPGLGRIHRWYLYIPSAFLCMAISRVWMDCRLRQRVIQKGLIPIFGALIAYYGLVLIREGNFWRETSALSEEFILDLLPYINTSKTPFFLINLPSAYTPGGSLGGKPMFAFALTNAVSLRLGEEVIPPVVVNHLWLLNRSNFSSRFEKIDGGRFRITVKKGGYFSFHGLDAEKVYAPDGRKVLKTKLKKPWGQVLVKSREEIELNLDLSEGAKVIIYNEGRIEEVQ